jgi:RHH-type proline utilization regulon transcriptional repressor/proline dehydrogenase/delta 1-pyrroline-5-carboxylate dehydrogenase
LTLPGPTGESNQLRLVPRGLALCLGPGWKAALTQAVQALAVGGSAILIVDPSGQPAEALQEWRQSGLPVDAIDSRMMPHDWTWLEQLEDFALVACTGPVERNRSIRQALARRDGELKPLVTEILAPERYVLERLLCVDTTAAGGNASLLASSEGVGSLAVSAGGV